MVFVLATTDPLKVAPTIRSRTQHYEFTLYTVDEIVGHLADVCAKEGVDADPEALAVIARAGAGSMRDSLSLLDQAIAHGARRRRAGDALFGGHRVRPAGSRSSGAVADEDVAGALVALGELLDAGHEPRRLTEDLLATVTRRVPAHVGAADGSASTSPTTTRPRSRALGEQVGAPMLVRTLETLGQAVVDMRGTDAADPRLVLEIALVRLARREAGTPLQALAERVDRLERGGAGAERGGTARRHCRPGPAAAADGRVRPRTRRSPTLRARADGRPRRRRNPSPSRRPPEPAAAPGARAGTGRRRGDVDIDDVIVAWAEILPDLPPATRAAVREAQPLAVDDDVITFGVPKAHYDAAVPRFKKEADNIRDRALAEARPAHDVQVGARTTASTPTRSTRRRLAATDDGTPRRRRCVDLAELVDDGDRALRR